MNDKTAVFLEYNRLLFTLAYNMLGDIPASESVVGEVYLQWLEDAASRPGSVKGYLVKTAVRQCIDHTGGRMAEGRGARPFGFRAGPYLSLSAGLMVFLKTLDPSKRALFILREVFAYDFRELAFVFDNSEDECREVYQRVVWRLGGGAGRWEADVRAHEMMLHRLMGAILERDADGIAGCLAADVMLLTDKGEGWGRADVTRRILDTLNRVLSQVPGFYWELAITNGLPSIISYIGADAVCLNSFESDGERIRNIYIQTDPAKLKQLKKAGKD